MGGQWLFGVFLASIPPRMAELDGAHAQQISVEAAQPKLDLAILEKLPSKDIILGVIDLSDMAIETPQTVAERIRRALPHVAVKGLVAIPPPTNDPEQARRYFRRLRELALGRSPQPISTISLKELSMSMSNDYHVAVEEGATMVRLGMAIFGARRA